MNRAAQSASGRWTTSPPPTKCPLEVMPIGAHRGGCRGRQAAETRIRGRCHRCPRTRSSPRASEPSWSGCGPRTPPCAPRWARSAPGHRACPGTAPVARQRWQTIVATLLIVVACVLGAMAGRRLGRAGRCAGAWDGASRRRSRGRWRCAADRGRGRSAWPGLAARLDAELGPPVRAATAWHLGCVARLDESLRYLGKLVGQPVTVKVAEATLPLWRPLAWKVSFLPG